MASLIEQAHNYLERGWPMVPSTGPKKAPAVAWKKYQTELPTEEEFRHWAGKNPERWGFITGALAGVIVVDFDGSDGAAWLAKWGLKPHVRTGSGGHHVYFRHPGWKVPTLNSFSAKDMWPWRGVDVRGDGGFIVLLGTNQNGPYIILHEAIEPYPFESIPSELFEFLLNYSRKNDPDAPGLPELPEPGEQLDPVSAFDEIAKLFGLERVSAGAETAPPTESVRPADAPPTPSTSANKPATSISSPKKRVSVDLLIKRALQHPMASGRNNGGFWLAAQLRDEQYSREEAWGAMLEYRRSTPGTNARGEREEYTEAEARATLDSAFSAPAREPWPDRRPRQIPGSAPPKNMPVEAAPGDTIIPSNTELIQAEEEITWAEKVAIAQELFKQLIESKDHNKIYGTRDTPAPYLVALAQLGKIEQNAAARKLKEIFGKDFRLKEWELQLNHEIQKIRKEKHEGDAYIVNDKGGFSAIVANAITMISELPIEWNSFTYRVFLTAESPWGSTGNWTDYDDVKCAEWCQRRSLHITPRVAMEAAMAVAMSKKPHFHPVTSYLGSLIWDGTGRLDRWLADYLGVEDNVYSRAVASKWAIAAVKRVFEPGCQSDYTLVLEGSQGRRKSSALRTLVGAEWFTDDITDIGSKDSAMQLQGKWVIELAELDAFRRADITTIKAWLVRREDHYRPPYARRAEDFPRNNVFAASTNKDDWGVDDTGLRRFWPVRVGSIDIDGLAAAREQLWAEAVARYRNCEETYFSDTIEGAAAKEQHDRQEVDPWTTLIEEWVRFPFKRSMSDEPLISTPEAIHLPEILFHCLGIQQKDWNRAHKDRVTRVLRLLKFRSYRAGGRLADGSNRPWLWMPLYR